MAAPNAARNAEIIRLRKAGMWPRAIAQQMGLSHNAVIGVCNRAGLSGAAGHAECPRGDQSPLAKLTAAQVEEARRIYVPRHPHRGCRALAQRFGVHELTMHMALRGKSWKHLLAPSPSLTPETV